MTDAKGTLEEVEMALRSQVRPAKSCMSLLPCEHVIQKSCRIVIHQASKASDAEFTLRQAQLDLKEKESALEVAKLQNDEMRESLLERVAEVRLVIYHPLFTTMSICMLMLCLWYISLKKLV